MPRLFILFLTMMGLTMTQTSVANAAKSLILNTTQGQIEIELLQDVAPNHVARI